MMVAFVYMPTHVGSYPLCCGKVIDSGNKERGLSICHWFRPERCLRQFQLLAIKTQKLGEYEVEWRQVRIF